MAVELVSQGVPRPAYEKLAAYRLRAIGRAGRNVNMAEVLERAADALLAAEAAAEAEARNPA